MDRFRLSLAALCMGCALGVVGADEKSAAPPSQAGIRELIRTNVDREGNVQEGALAKLGLKKATALSYRLIVRNQDGSETTVDESKHVFKSGDQFRLVVETETDVYLYVFHQSIDGTRRMMVPDRIDPRGFVPRVERGRKNLLPPDGYFVVTPPGGAEHLMVFASPVKIPDLTRKQMFTRPEQLSAKQQTENRAAQDRVFQLALNSRVDDVARLSGSFGQLGDEMKQRPKLRLRGLSWEPKHTDAKTGKSIVVGSVKADEHPCVFVDIPVRSK